MTKTILTSSDDIRSLGTILSLWAHPDDETFTCAGIMAAAIKNGQRVVCITATRGEAGVQDESRWPASRLAGIRSTELGEAFKLLGVAEHHWLDYPDGGCAEIPDDEASSRLAQYLDIYNPDTILTFGPDGLTGHDDHKAVYRWACKAVAESGKQIAIYCAVERQYAYNKYLKKADKQLNIYFNIDRPKVKTMDECDIYYNLSPEIGLLKRKALSAMPSQMEKLLNMFRPEELEDMFSSEAFLKR